MEVKNQEIIKLTKPNGDTVDIKSPEGKSPTSQQWINSLWENQKNIVSVMNNWYSYFSQMIANSTKIYTQIDSDYNDNNIHIHGPKALLKTTSVLLVLPIETIDVTLQNEDGSSKLPQLIIHYGVIINPEDKVKTIFNIVKEDYNGNIVPLEQGDISANRLCVFRIDPYDTSRVILCHALSFDSLGVNKLVCNEATFTQPPKVMVDNKPEYLMSAKAETDLFKVLDSVYQKKIVIGTEPPEAYIKNNFLEEGQIYIQHEE